MQECKRQTLELESRLARFFENYVGKYEYGSNNQFDEAELSNIFLSEILRMSHRVTYNCLYAWRYDVYEGRIKPLAQKGIYYNFRNFLQNDVYIFDDFMAIAQILVIGFFDGTV